MLECCVVLLIIIVIIMWAIFIILCSIGADISSNNEFMKKNYYKFLLENLNKRGKNGKFRYKK